MFFLTRWIFILCTPSSSILGLKLIFEAKSDVNNGKETPIDLKKKVLNKLGKRSRLKVMDCVILI